MHTGISLSRVLIYTFLNIIMIINVYGQEIEMANRYVDSYKNYLSAKCPLEEDQIKHFVYFMREREQIIDHPFLKVEKFEGAQIMYSWKQLEPEKDNYDFSIINIDLEYLKSHGKQLFIQLQDATFSPKYKGLPSYILEDDEYDGGASRQFNDQGKGKGWVAKRWNENVQKRFSLLLMALGKEFDGSIEGINLQESAIGVRNSTDSTFTSEQYVDGLKNNMLALKKTFPNSTTMQYANFIPGEWLPWKDKGYLRSIYKYGEEIGVGLGGPDLMFHKKGQLNHTIALMHENKYTVPLGIAIQEGNYIGETANIDVVQERENLVPLLHAFAKEFLKVNYMFWVIQEPYFSEDVIPCFSERQ